MDNEQKIAALLKKIDNHVRAADLIRQYAATLPDGVSVTIVIDNGGAVCEGSYPAGSEKELKGYVRDCTNGIRHALASSLLSLRIALAESQKPTKH